MGNIFLIHILEFVSCSLVCRLKLFQGCSINVLRINWIACHNFLGNILLLAISVYAFTQKKKKKNYFFSHSIFEIQKDVIFTSTLFLFTSSFGIYNNFSYIFLKWICFNRYLILYSFELGYFQITTVLLILQLQSWDSWVAALSS